MDTKTELISMCERIVKEIESGEYEMDERDVEEWGEPCAGHYLDDAVDIEYTVSRDVEYLGSKVCVTFGDPNIYIDTRKKQVQGYWGGDYVERSYASDALGLYDYLAEMFDCLRG